ncbi:hypothetical protein X738_30760 [Mesorhizobium sp. LNHC209A00]|nr:hypothetical protein X738_30760 [Mesorhizobium sp. LNHC209A00]
MKKWKAIEGSRESKLTQINELTVPRLAQPVLIIAS